MSLFGAVLVVALVAVLAAGAFQALDFGRLRRGEGEVDRDDDGEPDPRGPED